MSKLWRRTDFDPATQKYKCEYCNSLFTQEELDAMKPMQGGEPDAVAQEQEGGERADETAAAEQTAGERESEPEARRCITAVRPAAQRL